MTTRRGWLGRMTAALFGEHSGPDLAEKAPVRSSATDAWQPAPYNPDDLAGRYGISIYQKMLREPYVKAALRQIKMGVTSLQWEVAPASDAPGDIIAADFIRSGLEQIEGVFEQDLYDILDALDVGYSITEKVWRIVPRGPFAGKIGLRCLKAKDPALFEFETDEFLNITALLLTLDDLADPAALDPADFIIFAHLGRYESPYGCSELRAAYRAYWLIDNIWKFRALYLEKFGGPTLVAKHPPGALESERARLLDILATIQSETGIVIPDDVTIEAIDIATNGEADYRSAIHDLRKEILVGILGSFLTTEEGDRTGARAMGMVHRETVDIFIRFLARLLGNTINEQLVRPLVELNFADAQTPRFRFIEPAPGQLHKE